jgi:hypothetical protein
MDARLVSSSFASSTERSPRCEALSNVTICPCRIGVRDSWGFHLDPGPTVKASRREGHCCKLHNRAVAEGAPNQLDAASNPFESSEHLFRTSSLRHGFELADYSSERRIRFDEEQSICWRRRKGSVSAVTTIRPSAAARSACTASSAPSNPRSSAFRMSTPRARNADTIRTSTHSSA